MEEALPESCRQLAVCYGQQVVLAAVHEVGLDGIAVVVADQVKDAVRDEELELEGERDPETARLALRSVRRNHDLTDESAGRLGDFQRKGQDVRPPRDAAESAVEATDLHVGDERDLDAATFTAEPSERSLGSPGQRPKRDENPALVVLDGGADERHGGPEMIPQFPNARGAPGNP
jgi:hypothetical protein